MATEEILGNNSSTQQNPDLDLSACMMTSLPRNCLAHRSLWTTIHLPYHLP